jgi:PadR family transcriptional regulator PadR
MVACYILASMEAKNTISQMRRGILEFCIVSVLADQEVYTAELIDSLKSANLIVTDGTLYPMLNRLQKAKLLQYRWEESESGPPRKYYSLTTAGVEYLSKLGTAWKDMTTSVETIRRGIESE